MPATKKQRVNRKAVRAWGEAYSSTHRELRSGRKQPTPANIRRLSRKAGRKSARSVIRKAIKRANPTMSKSVRRKKVVTRTRRVLARRPRGDTT